MKHDWRNILFVGLLLFVGIVTVLVVNAFMNMQTEGLLVGILLAPLLAYAVLTGGIREFSAFGVSVKSAEAAAKEPIQPDDIGSIGPSVEDIREVGTKGFAALGRMLDTYELSEAKHIVMIIKLGSEDYPRKETLGFIEKLSRYQSFKFIIFLGSDDQVFAYMPSRAAKEVLSGPSGDVFLSIVSGRSKHHELGTWRCVYNIKDRDTISIEDDNATALRKMEDLHLDAILVVDAHNHLMGIVERDGVINRIVNRIILKMIKK